MPLRSQRPDELARLADRVRALGEAVQECEGRVSDAAVEHARRVARQVDRRLAVSGGSTVVALAGATGSGKSSLFNALAGTELAPAGVRRPTTSQPMAAIWGREPTEELLDWLGVSRRHGVLAGGFSDLDGLVLLDLPDHDSTEMAHRLEVDRLVQLVDVLVWVVDPQKYADAALHEHYLKPYASYADVMLVVLNQADTLSATELETCRADLRRLLDSEGLAQVPIETTSAATGVGLDRLQARLVGQVADKRAAARRLAADVTAAARTLEEASGVAAAPGVERSAVQRMNQAVAAAAGTDVVTDAVRQAWRLRGGLATGWPVLAWVAKFRPDPLRRLRLVAGSVTRSSSEEPAAIGRTSLPASTGVQRSRVDSAVRALAEDAARGLERGWSDAVKAAARSRQEDLPDALDAAVAATDLDVDRHRRWWQVVRVLQWALFAAVVVGLLWFGSAFLLAYLRLPPLPEVTWWGWPAPLLLGVGGVLAGLAVAGLSRIGVEIGAGRRERAARRALRGAIGRVTDEQVVRPVRLELERYERAVAALSRAGVR